MGFPSLFTPSPAMVKQLLMASGYDDPLVMSMVDRIMGGGFSTPSLQPCFFDMFRIPEGAQTLLVSAENTDEEITIVVTCRKKEKKTLDNPK